MYFFLLHFKDSLEIYSKYFSMGITGHQFFRTLYINKMVQEVDEPLKIGIIFSFIKL